MGFSAATAPRPIASGINNYLLYYYLLLGCTGDQMAAASVTRFQSEIAQSIPIEIGGPTITEAPGLIRTEPKERPQMGIEKSIVGLLTDSLFNGRDSGYLKRQRRR